MEKFRRKKEVASVGEQVMKVRRAEGKGSTGEAPAAWAGECHGQQ